MSASMVDLPVAGFDERGSLIGAGGIVLLATDTFGQPVFGQRRVSITAQVGKLAQLRVRAAAQPLGCFSGQDRVQFTLCVFRPAQSHERGAVVIAPPRVFAVRFWAGVTSEALH